MRKYSEGELSRALAVAGVPEDVAGRVLMAARERSEDVAQFEAAHIAYYLGALLIIGAMGWFITDAWDRLSGVALLAIALAYAVAFACAAAVLSKRPNSRVPVGLLTTVAVCMTPLAVYGLERQIGLWPVGDPGGYSRFHPWGDANWVWMESATVLVAALALRYVRFPFVTAPAAYALWYLSMDATALLFGKQWTFRQECWISVAFGVVMLLLAYFADGETDQDFAFWFYLFGLLALSGGLSLLGTGSQLGRAVYCLLHLGFIVLSIVLKRRAFLVFGALGLFAYLVSEAQHFHDALGFTFGLTAVGVLFLLAGLVYKRSEPRLAARLAPLVPARVRQRHERLAFGVTHS